MSHGRLCYQTLIDQHSSNAHARCVCDFVDVEFCAQMDNPSNRVESVDADVFESGVVYGAHLESKVLNNFELNRADGEDVSGMDHVS